MISTALMCTVQNVLTNAYTCVIHQARERVHHCRRLSRVLFKSMPALESPEAATGSISFTID